MDGTVGTPATDLSYGLVDQWEQLPDDRIQIFSPDGEYLDQWANVQRQTNITFDRDGMAYVSELWRRPDEPSFR